MSKQADMADVKGLYAAAEPHFRHWEVVKDLVDQMIDLIAELPPERPPGRLALEGAPAARAHAVGRHALGHPAPLAALRRPLRALGRPHRAARLRHARRAQRGAARAPRRAGARPPTPSPTAGKWALTWEDLLKLRRRGGPARPRRDGGQDPLPQVQHRARRATACPPAAGEALALKRAGAERGQGLRRRGRGRPDRRAPATRRRTRPGAWASTTSSSWSTGTTSASTTTPISRGRPRHAARLVRALRLARASGTEQGTEWGPVTRALLEAVARREPRPDVPRMVLVQDAQGPRLRQVRQQVARHAARP